MWSYLSSDPRYKNVKPQRRQTIFAWVQREFRNLLKAREADVRVPTPHHFLHNILIQEYITDGKRAAPQLNKTEILDPQKLYDDLMEEMRKLYHGAKLIHGDLSPFNILYDGTAPVIIDMSQTTAIDDPNAKEYIARDVKNMTTFFQKQGLFVTEEDIQKSAKLPLK
jgi:RIO kinase 1